jgi:hypothetical protein
VIGCGRKPPDYPSLAVKEPRMPAVRTLRFAFLCILSLMFAGFLWAQKDTGSITGTVKDPSGAMVSGAKVSVTDVERGQT